jgi:hypothetical protein
MNSLSELNIFDFLNIKNLDERETSEYLARISRISIQQAVEKAVKDNLLSLEDLEKLTQEVTDPLAIQEQLVAKCPKLTEYVQEAVDNMKLEILRKQIDETLQLSSQYSSRDFTPVLDLKNYIARSITDIDSNLITEKLKAFRDFQNNLLTNQNGN